SAVGDGQLVAPLPGHVLWQRWPGCDRAGELVVDTAAARAEALAQPVDLLRLADEQRLPPHAVRAHQRPRQRLVAPTEDADQQGDEESGGDVEPERREVLPRADRKRERERSDEDDGGSDPP